MSDKLETPTTDINELFNRQPTDYSDEDIDQIILHYRTTRHTYRANPAHAAAAKPKTAAQKRVSGLDIKLDL